MPSTDDILGGASADGEPIGFKRHLVLPALIFLALEVMGIVVPILSLFGDRMRDSTMLLRMAIPMLVGAQLVWSALLWSWLRPIYGAISVKRQGKRLPESVAMAAYQATWRIPLYALGLRTVLWSIIIFGLGLFLVEYAGWEIQHALELTAIGTFHALVCNIGRAVWLHYLFGRFRKRLFGKVSLLRQFADGYFRALMLVSIVCVGATLAAISAFTYFFMPMTTEQYLHTQVYYPIAFILITIGMYIHTKVATRRLNVYLEAQQGAKSSGEGLATAVYRDAQSLPYRLALTTWLLWLVACAVSMALSRTWHLDSDDAVLMFGTVIAIAIGASLYQALWHREHIGPLLDHLTVSHRVPVRGIRTALSLRAKLLLSFGGTVLFAVGLAFFWGFIQYKNLVTKFTASQAELGLAWVRSEVQGAVAASEIPPSPTIVQRVLTEISEEAEDSSVVHFFLPKARKKIFAVGGGPMGTPVLPWYALAEMQLVADATISLNAHSLTGSRGKLEVSWHGNSYDLGAVAVFYPNYRGRGPSLVRPLKELLIFFFVLLGVCGGIVVLTVSQFVRPIRRLESRADGMARGELAEPVSSGGEGDEIGRLTFALEEMRRALRDKLRSTEEVNLDLERAVQRRTSDLAKKNRELAETLEKLTRAQDQLVQAEKMASIGQLVAGIAHEINNPVNAIVNTVGPLGEAIEYLDADDPEVREEAADDVKDMIRVVQRGAQRTKTIVQALHNYSRTDEESVVEVDLNRSLDDSLELLRHILKGRVSVKRAYEDVGRVVGHAGQLNQVFMNLLTNAAQAVANKDDATVTVATGALESDRVVVSIGDNGSGMSPEVMGRIFDPFFTTKDVGEGSGLGLSIVHGIVERHQGTIEVSSEPGKGTTFRVILPRGEGVPITQGSASDTLV